MTASLTIEIQGTPNPNAAKFTLNRPVAARGVTYRDPAAAEADWARQLLALPGVTQVFGLGNFISVTKTADADWAALAPQVEQVLREVFA